MELFFFSYPEKKKKNLRYCTPKNLQVIIDPSLKPFHWELIIKNISRTYPPSHLQLASNQGINLEKH